MTLEALRTTESSEKVKCAMEPVKYMQKIVCLIIDYHKTYTPLIRSYAFPKLMQPGVHRWCMTPFAVRRSVSKHGGAGYVTAARRELLWLLNCRDTAVTIL